MEEKGERREIGVKEEIRRNWRKNSSGRSENWEGDKNWEEENSKGKKLTKWKKEKFSHKVRLDKKKIKNSKLPAP